MAELTATAAGRAGDNPLWRFSLEVYQRDGVAPACLALQDRHGLDVNLLLFCCWAAGQGRGLARDEIGHLEASVASWQREIIAPLRRLRHRLKDYGEVPAAEALRQQIKENELHAEAIEQSLLLARLPDDCAELAGRQATLVAATNLMAYFGYRGVTADSTDTADLAAILRGCWPALAPLEAVWLLSETCAEPV